MSNALAKDPQRTKFYTAILVSLMLVGAFIVFPAISLEMSSVTIQSTGHIGGILSIYADSGHADDIQTAVDQVVAAGGIGNVYIPAGVFNFVNADELLRDHTVSVPAGVSIFGAPTDRTSGLTPPTYGRNPNDQVVEWKTTLVIPAHACAPTGPGADINIVWFSVQGTGDPSKPSRISDIEFVGYREFDPTSTQMTEVIRIDSVVNFRVDHNHFLNIAGITVRAFGRTISGVIDHIVAENPAGGIPHPYGGVRTLTYGVTAGRDLSGDWDPDISNILGQYTDYTVFIEDSYFEKWRHCIASNLGAHYVWRHNTIDYDYGHGSVDAHGGNAPQFVGTRAIEVYNNEFKNRIESYFSACIFLRGGSAAIFNNYDDGSYQRFIFVDHHGNTASYTWPDEVWIWDNNSSAPSFLPVDAGTPFVEGSEYFLHEPHTFQYSPYTYPHPLTIRIYP